MAWLSAAEHLKSGLTDVQILEASNRIGGRINTHTFGEYHGNPALIELGANWIHGTNGNAVFSLAKENNLLNPYVLLEKMKEQVYSEDGGKISRALTEKVWKVFKEIEMGLKDIVPEDTTDAGTVSGRRYCQKYDVRRQNSRISSWKDAKRACERMGMALLKVDNFEEDMFLQKFLNRENPGYNADGWFIGGVYRKGEWKWSDGSRMNYQAFPGQGLGYVAGAQDVTNYAFIMKKGYQWGYVSPFGSQRMGYICESTRC
ncbi:peroxisomal N(1)-acetyl-spermine/spermidine oxidase-like [Ostrea edulis]|uniref:peroxisomal N(1)-acetyl-spermine/spermidine oxidase-like n=1 Tax=Ostrea edulis TaxID=37623 RepID=UPI0024AF6266|nr:peroxisomal N(1)-acetyl-spermine/spermidine oxidase-like [Ostrea edulis]